MTFFSIILPTYNRANFLARAVESVQNQIFEDWELIIVDDGSTDNTVEVINNYQSDLRIKYIYQENAERSAARNNGIKNAKGQYICFLDSDDEYKINHLFDLFNFMKGKNYPVCITHCGYEIHKVGQKKEIKEAEIPETNNLVEFFFTNPISPIRVCIHQKITEEFEFDEKINIGEDSCLWMQVVIKYPHFVSSHIGVIYTLHNGNSVNLSNPSAVKMYEGIKYFFSKHKEIRRLISYGIYQSWVSRIMTNIAIYYSMKNQRKNAVLWTFRAIFLRPLHEHTIFRFFLILHILGLKKAPYEQN